MKASVLIGPRTICLQEFPIPEVQDHEVRIRMEGCGVCGSNLPPWEGRDWFTYPFSPGHPGHEGWGHIDAIGGKVTKWQVGDRVAALTYKAFAEFDVAPEDSVVALPQALSGKPFPGEALGCAVNVFRRCDVQQGQWVAIVGIGFLGALLTRLCARAGARVIALSRRPFALELARHYGAEHTISLDEHHGVIKKVRELTGDVGCDRVIEAVGAQWPLDIAGELTRERGRLIIAGYHQDGPRQVNMQLWNWRGLDVINAHERDSRVYLDGMRAAVELVAADEIDPSPLYTHRFKLNDISEAFRTVHERPHNFMKALIIA